MRYISLKDKVEDIRKRDYYLAKSFDQVGIALGQRQWLSYLEDSDRSFLEWVRQSIIALIRELEEHIEKNAPDWTDMDGPSSDYHNGYFHGAVTTLKFLRGEQ